MFHFNVPVQTYYRNQFPYVEDLLACKGYVEVPYVAKWDEEIVDPAKKRLTFRISSRSEGELPWKVILSSKSVNHPSVRSFAGGKDIEDELRTLYANRRA